MESVKRLEEKSKDEIYLSSNKKDKFKKKRIIIGLLLVILLIIIICLIVLILYLKNQKKKEQIKENNSIYAKYEIKSGKALTFFNQNETNLKDEDYYIDEIVSSENNLRYLKSLEINHSLYMPEKNGILSVEIKFKKNLNSLDNFFRNNKELIQIDIGKLEMKEVKSMKLTFSGCSNLEEFSLEGANTEN